MPTKERYNVSGGTRNSDRWVRGERRCCGRGRGRYDEFEAVLRHGDWDALEIDGRVVTVDTTDFETVDYDQIISEIGAY